MGSYSIRNVGIVNELDRLEKDMQFMKSRQFIGKKTLATKSSKSQFYTSSVIYHVDGQPMGQAIIENLVTFTADQQLNPFGVLTIEIYDINGNLQENDPVDESGPRLRSMNFLPGIVNDKKLRWDIDLPHIAPLGSTGTPFKVKFVVSSTDSGTISAEEFSPGGA